MSATTTAHETWRAKWARHKMLPVHLVTQILGHAKITCAEVRVRGIGVVFTPPVADKGIAIAWKRNTLQLGLKSKKITVHLNSMPATMCLMTTTTTTTNWRGCRRIPFPSSFRIYSFCSFAGSWELLILSLPYLFAGVEFCVSFSRLFVQQLFDFFWLRRGLHVGSSDRFSLGFWVPVPNFLSVLLRSVAVATHEWSSFAIASWRACQYGVISHFLCLFSHSVSCVVNSLSPSMCMTCAVRWTFLYHVVRNR